MKTCSFQGFAGIFDFVFSQTVAIDLVFTVIVTKSALIFTISGEVDETVKKYPVAKIMISYLPGCVIKFFQIFFGLKREKSPQVIVRSLKTFNYFFPEPVKFVKCHFLDQNFTLS